MSKHYEFADGTVIEINDDNSIAIEQRNDALFFNETDKIFASPETGESVMEYSGVATDGREEESWAKATFYKGGASVPHYHSERTEVYYITNGKAVVTIDGMEHRLFEGDCITIEQGMPHAVSNGGEDVMELIVKCSPAWVFTDHNIIKTAEAAEEIEAADCEATAVDTAVVPRTSM